MLEQRRIFRVKVTFRSGDSVERRWSASMIMALIRQCNDPTDQAYQRVAKVEIEPEEAPDVATGT